MPIEVAEQVTHSDKWARKRSYKLWFLWSTNAGDVRRGYKMRKIQDLDNGLCILFRKEVMYQKWWRGTRCAQPIEARWREKAECGHVWSPGRCPMPRAGAVPSAPHLPCSWLWWWDRPWLEGPYGHHGEPPSLREQPALTAPWQVLLPVDAGAAVMSATKQTGVRRKERKCQSCPWTAFKDTPNFFRNYATRKTERHELKRLQSSLRPWGLVRMWKINY